jgi:hypothetical protein
MQGLLFATGFTVEEKKCLMMRILLEICFIHERKLVLYVCLCYIRICYDSLSFYYCAMAYLIL